VSTRLPRRPLYSDEKIFGPLTLIWVVRILLALAILTLIIFTLQLIQINNAAHDREELHDSVCILIGSHLVEPLQENQKLLKLAQKDDCPPVPSASPTPSPTK
jgi:hypothetical protein